MGMALFNPAKPSTAFLIATCLLIVPPLAILAFPTNLPDDDIALIARDDKTSMSAAALLLAQLKNPSGVLAVLTIIGGDIVQKAIAQMTGSLMIPFHDSLKGPEICFAPVAFSFGWVGYAFSSLMSVFGEGVLMPETDHKALVIDIDSGSRKENESWVLGRLIRDLSLFEVSQENKGKPPEPAIYFYWAAQGAGRAHIGKLWMAVFVLPLQFFIASVPDWDPRRPTNERSAIILIITGIGTFLALATGAIPQWHKERFPAARNTTRNFVLTKGNGHSTCFVILNPVGTLNAMNLEHLAIVQPEMVKQRGTKVLVVVLMLCWLLLLLLIAGLESDGWYLFGVGALGMLQNVYVAGRPRHARSHGVPIERFEVIPDPRGEGKKSTMEVIQAAEVRRPYLGLRLLDVFFQDVRPEEKKFWDMARASVEVRATRLKLDAVKKARKRRGQDLTQAEMHAIGSTQLFDLVSLRSPTNGDGKHFTVAEAAQEALYDELGKGVVKKIKPETPKITEQVETVEGE